MRQLLIEVQRGQGNTVLQLAEKYQGANLSQLEANTHQRQDRSDNCLSSQPQRRRVYGRVRRF